MILSILTIGDELLNGQTIDTNSAFITQALETIGIKTKLKMTIADDAIQISKGIEIAFAQSDILITTGGLGPTKDDITKKTVADFFQVDLVRNEAVYKHVEEIFKNRNLPFLPINSMQADVLRGSEVLHNDRGTAPGIWYQKDQKILIMLPGVPHEMEFLVKHRIIPKLISSVDLPKIYYRYIDTYSMGESFIAQRIEPLLNNMPDEITLSYLPSAFQVTLRLSSTEEFKAQTDQYADIISDVLSQITIQKSNRDIFQYFNKVLANAPYTVSVWDEFTMGYWYFLVSEADFFTPAKIKYFLNSSYTKSDIEDESACLHVYVSKPTIDEVKKTLNVTLEFKNNHVHWQKNIDLFYNKKNNKNAIAKAICFYSIAYLNSDI